MCSQGTGSCCEVGTRDFSAKSSPTSLHTHINAAEREINSDKFTISLDEGEVPVISDTKDASHGRLDVGRPLGGAIDSVAILRGNTETGMSL